MNRILVSISLLLLLASPTSFAAPDTDLAGNADSTLGSETSAESFSEFSVTPACAASCRERHQQCHDSCLNRGAARGCHTGCSASEGNCMDHCPTQPQGPAQCTWDSCLKVCMDGDCQWARDRLQLSVCAKLCTEKCLKGCGGG